MKAVNNSTDLFRKALGDIYQIFLSEDPKENATEKALAKIKSLYNADRIQLIHLDNDNNTLHFVCEIANSKKEKISTSLGKLMHGKSTCFQKDLPWIVKQIKEGKQVIVTDIKKLPAEASTEKETLSKNNLNSFLCIPIFCCGGIYGFIGIDFQDKRSNWTENDKEDFNFFANTFSLYLEREKANKAVKQSRLQALRSDILFENIFETLPVGIELYDEKGYLININPYELEVLGTTTEGILGINIFDNPTLSKEEIEAIKAGKEVTFERDYNFQVIQETGYYISNRKEESLHLIGKLIPLKDTANNIFGYLLLNHQDAGYYLDKETLRISLEKLRLAVSTQDSFFWEYDPQKDNITIDYDLLDPRRKEQYRTIQKMQLTNRISHLQNIHPEDVGRVLQQLNLMLNGKIDFFTETYKYNLNNEYRWFTTSFRTYKYDLNNNPETIVCLTTDISEQRRNEFELAKAKEANKIKTAFIENMSHEIRTPMNVIVGFSSILAENNNNSENQYLIELIQRNNEILLRLIDSLLSFTELESEAMRYTIEVMDIKSVCKDVLKIKSFNRKPEIKFALKEGLPSIMLQTDRERLIQVLYQLLDNANKYTQEGEVKIAYSLQENDQIKIEISDTGIGMTEKELEKIFSHFYKTDPFQIGVGLGLSIAKKIVEDLGGKIGVYSNKEKGSTFWFTLPLMAIHLQGKQKTIEL